MSDFQSRPSTGLGTGPSTALVHRHDLTADLEPSHLKIGVLVREAAEHSAGILLAKRGT